MTDPAQAPRPVVLAVYAHPDDETLGAGPALAQLATWAQVHLITATRGERGELIGPGGVSTDADPEAMAATRTAEHAAAAAALGLASARFLDGLAPGDETYVDSGMAWADESHTRAVPAPDSGPAAFSRADLGAEVAVLAAEILRLRPVLVLTEEPGGGYGHPDHIRVHEVTMAAVGQAAREHRVPLVAWTIRDRQRYRQAQEWLAAAPGVPASTPWGEPLALPEPAGPQASGVRDDADAILDTSAVVPAVLSAIRAYASQVHSVGEAAGADAASAAWGGAAGWYSLTDSRLQPVLAHAALHAAVGSGEDLRAFVLDHRLPKAARPPGRWLGVVLTVFAVLLGAMVAAAGTAFHRTQPPFGLLGALVAVAAGSALTRTLGERRTGAWYGLGVAVMVLAMTYLRPGADVLVAADTLGTVWLIAALLLGFSGMALPRRWFRDLD